MSEDGTLDNETSTSFDYGETDFSFVKDKYQADDRSPVEAAFEQAKAYSELEKRFGSFTGAPEAYELTFSDELKATAEDKGLELLDADSPRIEALFEKAKELNMNQEGVNALIELEFMDSVAQAQAYEEFKQEQIASLGADGQARISAIGKWADANLGDDADAFKSLATDAEQFKVIEKLINMTKNAPVVEPAAAPAPALTMEEIQAEQFKEDKYGNRLMQSDPEHRKKVQGMYERYEAQQNG